MISKKSKFVSVAIVLLTLLFPEVNCFLHTPLSSPVLPQARNRGVRFQEQQQHGHRKKHDQNHRKVTYTTTAIQAVAGDNKVADQEKLNEQQQK